MIFADTLFRRIHLWDEDVFLRISKSTINRKTLLLMARLISRSADGWGYLIVPIILWLTNMSMSGQLITLLVVALTLERTIYVLAKNSFKRKRPANIVPGYKSHIMASDEFSFPSGHTSAAHLFITLLVLIYGPAMIVLYFWAFSVACSRVLLGVHFPTDTLIGATLGCSTAMLVFEIAQL